MSKRTENIVARLLFILVMALVLSIGILALGWILIGIQSVWSVIL